jgi:hypothetical protein
MPAMTRIPNFETRYHESPRRIRIPHTGQYWDFCSVVEPDLLQTTVDAVAAKVQPGEASTPSDALKRCCVATEIRRHERAVGAIRAFLLRSDERCHVYVLFSTRLILHCETVKDVQKDCDYLRHV